MVRQYWIGTGWDNADSLNSTMEEQVSKMTTKSLVLLPKGKNADGTKLVYVRNQFTCLPKNQVKTRWTYGANTHQQHR